MEIVIHGTKGGYKNNFIPYAKSSFAVGDIRKGSADENPVGQSAYSIAFDNKGYIVTKYIIIRDTLRSYAVGFIGFSLFLPADKKLSGKGASIQSLLDEVSDLYKEHYIKSNNINCDKTTLIQEDWSFISQITAKYQEQTNPNEEQIDSISNTKTGTEFPAFIYYSSDEELQKYFDTPFQEEYNKYQQVLFIKAELKDKKENPLYILRNSGYDLTEKIDLVNPIYNIVIQSQSLKSINDTPLSLLDKRIRKFNHLILKWSKQYYSDIMKDIVISEDNNDPSVSIDHEKHIIMIQEPTEWIPQTKTIKIEVVDYKRNPIKDAHIYTENKTIIFDGVFTLEGENIGKSWRIIVEHGELIGEGTIRPNLQDRICITLHKSKDIELKINNNGFRQKGSFIPNDIKEKEYRIDLENLPQQGKSSKTHSLRKIIKKVKVILLASCILLLIGIIVMEISQILFTKKETNSSEIKESDIKSYIKGEHFKADSLNALQKSWEEQKPDKEFQLLKHCTWFSHDTVEWKKIKTDIEKAVSIRRYIDNKEFAALKDSMFSDKQQPFKNAIKDIDDDVIAALNDLDIPNMTLSEITDSINSIKKRVNESLEDPGEPKYIVEYLTRSQEFSLDSILKYHNIPGLSKRMNRSLNLIKKIINGTIKSDNFINQAANDPFISINVNYTDWAKGIDHSKEDTKVTQSNEQDQAFIARLRSAYITKEELEQYKNGEYKNSIDLYLVFWKKVKKSNQKKDFDDILNKIKNDKYLNKSELYSFVYDITKGSNDFNKYISISGKKQCKSISELIEKSNKK